MFACLFVGGGGQVVKPGHRRYPELFYGVGLTGYSGIIPYLSTEYLINMVFWAWARIYTYFYTIILPT